MMHFLEKHDFTNGKLNMDIFPEEYKNCTFVVMIMAEWCGHCKNAKPAFIEVAEMMTDNKEVVYCFIDVTADPDTKDITKSLDGFRGFPDFRVFDGKKDGTEVKDAHARLGSKRDTATFKKLASVKSS
jgi:thiol-disulfide isomerase/thioredoxin